MKSAGNPKQYPMRYFSKKEISSISRKGIAERLLHLGPESLTPKELLTVLTGSGISDPAFEEVARLLQSHFEQNSSDMPIRRLLEIKGIGESKALKISAALSFLSHYLNNPEVHSRPATQIEEGQQEYLSGILQGVETNPANVEDIGAMLNKVHPGDCLDVMRLIPSNSVDMILCDLPYGTTQNKWDSVIPLNRLWCEYDRILKKKGVVALTSQGVFTAKLILSNERLFKYKLVWEKSKPTNFLNAKKQPLRKHEDICIFYREQPVYNPQMSQGDAYNKGIRKNQLTGCYGDFSPVEVKSSGERYPLDVVYFKTAESEGPVFHPTQKPVGLGRYLIRTFTNPGDVVLDNACGSGSFLVAAALEDRQFIGIEKNTDVHLFKEKRIDYIQVCNDRIAQAKQMNPRSAAAK